MENTNNNTSDAIEIDLLELFFVLLDHIWFVIICTVTGAVAAYVITTTLITPIYSSSAMLYVLTRSTSITSLTDLQTGAQLTQDYKVFITSRPVVDKVISNLDLNMNYGAFVKNVTVVNENNTRILNVTVKNPDPQMAKIIVDNLADVSSARMAEVMETDAPNIVDYGHVSEKPTSPSKTNNTIIGAVLGLALAAAVVVIRHLMNDSIKSSEDIEKYLGLNTLGTIPLEEGATKEKRKSRLFNPNRKKKKKESAGDFKWTA